MGDHREVDVHLVVSYSPVTRTFQFERALGPIAFNDGQVFDWENHAYQHNYEEGNLDLIAEAGDQLESALRLLNTWPDAA